MRLRTASYIAAAVFAALGIYLFVAQSLALVQAAHMHPLFSAAGRFLFRSFRHAGFYVPLYLFLAAGLLMLPELKRRLLFAITAALLPVLTVSLILQLMGGEPGPAAQVIAEVFGVRVGATLLLILLAAELPAIYLLTYGAFGMAREEGGSGKGRRMLSAPVERPAASAAEMSPAAEEMPSEDSRAEAGEEEENAGQGWEYFEHSPGEVSFPDMPELPELRSLGGTGYPGDEEPPASAYGGSGAAGARPEVSGEGEDIDEPPREYISFRDFVGSDEGDEYRDSGEPADLLRQEEPEFEELKEASGRRAEETPTAQWLRSAPHTASRTAGGSNGSGEGQRLGGEEPGTFEQAGGEDPWQERSGQPEAVQRSRQTDGRGGRPGGQPGGRNGSHSARESSARGGSAEENPVRDTDAAEQEQLLPSIPAEQLVTGQYEVPEDQLLHEYPDSRYWVIDEETQQSAEVLKKTLEEFKISAEVTGIQKGPVITMFEILPAPGVKLSKIVNLADNIALRLAASRVRIVAPIPGKHAVGIEVPNKKRHLVSFKEMLQSEEFQEAEMEVPLILGKDITGQTQIVDLVQTPHLLIAGATGSGKSVCVNSIIASILYRRSPEEVRMILVDPKIVELKLYNDIPHLLTPVITEPKRAFQALQYCLYEMERRYSLLDALGVRDIKSYNRKIKSRKLATRPLPYIVVVVDEFADLMATSGKELEATLARLAAMSRAVGIHLVLATQRPSIDVITGLIKANIPSRIAFMVASKFDSRIIIDAVGAEKLLGKGDMLFTSAWNPNPTRMQGAYLSEDEVERMSEYVKSLGEPDYIDEEIFFEDEEEQGELFNSAANDPLMDKAVEVVAEAGKASASYLQRRLKVGYNRAARLVEEMEERGIVGPQNGSKPREILHIPEEHRE